ncbi:MAG: kynureninase [Bacteroidia bacterium]
MTYQTSADFAAQADANDQLSHFRKQFHFPQHQGKDVNYFTGNSLGLMPRAVRLYIETELKSWETYGVEGHFEGPHPWMHYHKLFSDKLARLVGALPEEVVCMNTLTTNLHLLMVSFYRPTNQRFKIIMEAGAFPSDQYAMESQVKFHGYTAEQAIIELAPRPGEDNLRLEDILAVIEREGPQTALVMMGGVNYYTGQLFNMAKITAAGHAQGTVVGFDLAHAAGNVPLKLHDWQVDFACWCSYKYLNSGPGGPAGIFIHQKHGNKPELPRFAGWWGHNESERFQMKKGFIPMQGAAGWQLSNAQVLAMAPHLASLDIFDQVGMDALRAKSEKLTGYLAYLLQELISEFPDAGLKTITPNHPAERGCQQSILLPVIGRKVFDYLQQHGVIADWREPDVIRVAPVPLYNSFDDVYQFYLKLRNALLMHK